MQGGRGGGVGFSQVCGQRVGATGEAEGGWGSAVRGRRFRQVRGREGGGGEEEDQRKGTGALAELECQHGSWCPPHPGAPLVEGRHSLWANVPPL